MKVLQRALGSHPQAPEATLEYCRLSLEVNRLSLELNGITLTATDDHPWDLTAQYLRNLFYHPGMRPGVEKLILETWKLVDYLYRLSTELQGLTCGPMKATLEH